VDDENIYYGDPTKNDAAERYVDMCRYIHNLAVNVVGVDNVTWVAVTLGAGGAVNIDS
jgi:hypothetical protein